MNKTMNNTDTKTIEEMKAKFKKHCDEYRLSGQDGLFIDWQMSWINENYTPNNEVNKKVERVIIKIEDAFEEKLENYQEAIDIVEEVYLKEQHEQHR